MRGQRYCKPRFRSRRKFVGANKTVLLPESIRYSLWPFPANLSRFFQNNSFTTAFLIAEMPGRVPGSTTVFRHFHASFRLRPASTSSHTAPKAAEQIRTPLTNEWDSFDALQVAACSSGTPVTTYRFPTGIPPEFSLSGTQSSPPHTPTPYFHPPTTHLHLRCPYCRRSSRHRIPNKVTVFSTLLSIIFSFWYLLCITNEEGVTRKLIFLKKKVFYKEGYYLSFQDKKNANQGTRWRPSSFSRAIVLKLRFLWVLPCWRDMPQLFGEFHWRTIHLCSAGWPYCSWRHSSI